MAKPRFLVDADEVLFDLQGPLLDIMSVVTGRRYRPEDFEVWDLLSILNEEQAEWVYLQMEAPGFCASLKPFPEAIKALERIRKHAEVIAVTSPLDAPLWVYERARSLKDHFGFTKNQIVHTSGKYLIPGDFFLDDKPEHVSSWASEHPTGCSMLWHTPNTRTLGLDHLRVFSWEQVLAKVA